MVTDLMRGEMFSQETDDGLLTLLTITHSDLAATIRVVNNHVDVTSRGNTFTAFPFEVTLPSDDPSQQQSAKLTIDNVNRQIGEAVRSISDAASVLIEAVQLNDPDTVEVSFPALNLRNVRWDAGKVTGDLLSDDVHTEPWPSGTFNPAEFPGLFT